MRKIFIDCGAFDGCSVRMFLDIYPNSKEFEIYSFEPNPNLAKYHPVSPSHFSNKAVWIREGEKNFYIHGTSGGSTIIREKSKHNNRKAAKKPKDFSMGKRRKVQCLDLSNWIKKNFKKEDYIILKMDIEGAEYPVLHKMIEDGSITYINQLYCEWHIERCGVSRKEDIKLKNQLSQYDLEILEEFYSMKRKYMKETNCTEYKYPR
jgi:FkbM family methyltransferase